MLKLLHVFYCFSFTFRFYIHYIVKLSASFKCCAWFSITSFKESPLSSRQVSLSFAHTPTLSWVFPSNYHHHSHSLTRGLHGAGCRLRSWQEATCEAGETSLTVGHLHLIPVGLHPFPFALQCNSSCTSSHQSVKLSRSVGDIAVLADYRW